MSRIQQNMKAKMEQQAKNERTSSKQIDRPQEVNERNNEISVFKKVEDTINPLTKMVAGMM